MRYEFHLEAEVELIEMILYYETQAPETKWGRDGINFPRSTLVNRSENQY